MPPPGPAPRWLAPESLVDRLLALPMPGTASSSGWIALEEHLLVYAQRVAPGRRVITGCYLPAGQGRLLAELALHLQRFEELKLMRGGGRRMLRALWGVVNLFYLLGILLVSHLTARGLTRPLADLEQVAARVGPGNWDIGVRDVRHDEIGTLEQAFVRMSHRLREATERWVASERAAAWQETARAIAHGIKNSLAPLKLALARIDPGSGADPARPDPLDTVRSELERLEKIARDFSRYGRPLEVRPQAAPLNPIVQQAVRLCEGTPGAEQIRLDLAQDLPRLRTDPHALREALVNLIRNACEAAEGSDTPAVTVTTARAGDGIEIAVQDHGPGLAEQVKDRLFQPYVTTKATGTGLGLPIVKKIVESLGGTVTCETGDRGSTFRLCWTGETLERALDERNPT